ncbi:alpha/beta fold hydrolase, partial [Mycetocola sp.]|uniref:alpha/beta fold hydrolase n=1 Tax=Mycetocola sp. TaxID=1871042 RepID=UPI00262383A8
MTTTGYSAVVAGRVWWQSIDPGTDATPLVLLHGGPGVPSYYLEPLKALADERRVVLYDQLGSGRSDHPDDPALWSV